MNSASSVLMSSDITASRNSECSRGSNGLNMNYEFFCFKPGSVRPMNAKRAMMMAGMMP